MNVFQIDWRWVLARGILGILFGALVLLFPLANLIAIPLLFGIYVLSDGITFLLAGWLARGAERHWWVFSLIGAIGVIAGTIAIAYPIIALWTLVLLISIWALASGTFQIYAAFKERRHLGSSMLLGFVGLLSILFGIVVATWPITGIIALITMTAVYALTIGFALTLWSFQLRRLRRTAERPMPREPLPSGYTYN